MRRLGMMPRWAAVTLMLTAALAGSAPIAAASEPSSARRTPLVRAVERALPSVVSITSEKRSASNSRWPFSPEENRRPRVNGMGTGVLIDERGFILTNQHVVAEVNDLRVFLADGTGHPAQLVQQDATTDLAILKIDAGRPLTAVRIGRSDDLMVGEQVITIGNAFGYENTTSVGIISALNRNVTLADDQVYRNLIQTDAGINPGNSGGPLLNMDGELIGINVATRAGAQGIGFALPIDDAKQVAVQMMSTRRLAGTEHGLVTTEADAAGRRVVRVELVERGSAAEAAGIRPGDEIVRINQVALSNPLDVERSLLGIRAGEKARVALNRDGQASEVELTMQSNQPAPPDPGQQVWQLLGLRAAAVTRDYVAAASDKLRGGLYVQDVQAGSLAERASLQRGDILVGMHVGEHHWETIRPENVLYILKQTETAQPALIRYYIVRQNVIHQGQMEIAGLATDAGSSLR